MTNDGPPLDPSADSADWELLARFAAGECAPDERARAQQWLDAHPDDARAHTALSQATSGPSFSRAPQVDVEAALRRVASRIEASDVRPLVRPKLPELVPARRWSAAQMGGFAAAAGLIIAALVTLRLRETQLPNPSPGGQSMVAQSTVAQPSPSGAAPRVYATSVAGRDSIELPDGSRVVLGPAARLTIPADYGQQHRTVELHGLAFFDVRHDADRPFSVRTAHAVINDVGTRFTVDDEAPGSVSVVVTAGSVELRSALPAAVATTSVVLEAGDRGTLDSAGRALAYHGVASDTDLVWMQGRLVFRDTPMARVAVDLRRWYGIELVTDSTLAGCSLKADLRRDDPREVVQRVLSVPFGARVDQRGDSLILRGGRCRP